MRLDFEKYFRMFLEEAGEYLREMHETVGRLAEASTPEAWAELFRRAHSIKGMAASLGLGSVQQVAHAMEDFLTWVQRQSDAPRRLEPLVEALECLGSLLRRPPSELQTPDTTVQAIVDRLRAVPTGALEVGPVDGSTETWVTSSGSSLAPSASPDAAVADRVRWEGHVTLMQGTLLPAARWAVVLRVLQRLGSLIETRPTAGDITQGKVGRHLSFVIESDAEAATIEAALRQIPDVEAVEVRRQALEVPVEPTSSDVLPTTIRVRLSEVDRLFDLARAVFMQVQRLRGSLSIASLEDEALLRDSEALARQLYLGLLDLRMLPLEVLIGPLRRMADALARQMGKRVRLVTRGEDLTLDKAVLEHLMDPFIHMIRNSVDHGIESPAERRAKSKSEEGYISIHAQQRGEWMQVVVLDDGRGMDVERIAQTALERGIVTPDQLRRMSVEEICMLVTIPGFSTAEAVTEVSGRGIGMDVVRHRVEALGGTLRIETRRDRGTRITLRIPSRLSILDTLIVGHGRYQMAIPMDRVRRVTPYLREAIHYRQEVPVLYQDGFIAPVLFMDQVLGEGTGQPRHQYYMLTIQYEKGLYVLAVADIRGEHRSVVQRLEPPLSRVPLFSGITVSPALEVIPLLDVEFIGQHLTPQVT
ncbi:MAG: ATP-binding protein [Acidobacteria bacterium]|nr:ATP-binding protein [Acidobacteriota bacterium]MDW7983660.1 ATP-binding protein [Acidobacteriota bacterium]